MYNPMTTGFMDELQKRGASWQKHFTDKKEKKVDVFKADRPDNKQPGSHHSTDMHKQRADENHSGTFNRTTTGSEGHNDNYEAGY